MRAVRFSALVGALFSLIAVPSMTYGAAQLKAGATTSAQPTAAVGTSLRQLQIAFDPDVVPQSTVTQPSPYNVTSFQLTVKYDASKLDVTNSDIQFIDPYTQSPSLVTGPSFAASPTGGSASNAFIDPTTGTISFIAGQTNVGNSQPGDVDIFSILFTLKSTTSNTDPLTFTILADPNSQDFIKGTNPNDPTDTATSTGADVTPTTITDSFSGYQAQIAAAAAVPLPAGALAGGVTLALVAVGYGVRRRVAVAA